MFKLRDSLIFIYCLAIVALNIFSAQEAPSPGSDPTQFGVASRVSHRTYPGGAWPSMTDEANAMASRGIHWAREEFLWLGIEPNQGEFFWTRTDYLVQELKTYRDIEILGVLIGTPAWASPAPTDPNFMFYPPSDLDMWYNYVYQTISRYKTSVKYWEIWNEPDDALSWRPSPSPQAYAQLLIKAFEAAKAADPSCVIVHGGLTWPDEYALEFLQTVYDAGAWSKFDIVAVHGFHTNQLPEELHFKDTRKRFAAGLVKFGLKPIWYTEIGWPTNPLFSDGISYDIQADYLVRDIVQSIGHGTDRIFWYNFRDNEANSTNWVDNLGIVNASYSSKNSAIAFTNLNNQLSGKTFIARRDPFLSTRRVLDTYEDSFGRSGDITITNEQRHNGNFSGKLTYSFASPGDYAKGYHDVNVQGTPTKLGLWVNCNNCNNSLSICFFDAEDEYFFLGLGYVIGFCWEYMEADINSAIWGSGSGNKKVDFPIRIESVSLSYNTSFGGDNKTSGFIYLDNCSSNTGDVGVNNYQFGSRNNLIDVIWTDNGLNANVPFYTDSLTIIDRDGTSNQVITDGGAGDQDGVVNNQIVIVATGEPNYIITWQDTSAYILDGYGGVHGGGSASALTPPATYFGWDIARDMELIQIGTGYYVLDGYGGVHAGGTALVIFPATPYFGWDIARNLELTEYETGYYVLDGFGGVHTGGTALAIFPATPYFDWDIARDLELRSSEAGYYVLDGFGGIHAGGTSLAISQSPYWWGWDIAKKLKLR